MSRPHATRPLARTVMAVALVTVVGCTESTAGDRQPSGDAATTAAPATADDTTATPDQQFPDVLEAEVTASGDAWSVAATISSPYDSPERYADAFRVVAPDGTVLGVRELLHDHAGEQPFTRSLDDVTIPDDVDEVSVEGRDLANGWGGDTVTVPVPR